MHRFNQVAVVFAVFGLSLVAALGDAQESVRFTVTADIRHEHDAYERVLNAMNTHVHGQGEFQVSIGDIDNRVWENRAAVDHQMGPSAIWFPGIGNHEAEDPVEMEWIRAEFMTGNDQRPPLETLVGHAGPKGCRETTYSWDAGNAHFIYLNQYWDGTTLPGSDVATDGDIVPELLAWLAADLAANTRPAVFVFGHEPAFPMHRHLNDSLNKYESNRDAFWALLERESVMTYFCGHTHVFSTYRHDGGEVTQIDVGNAGNESSFLDGQTFVSVTVESTEVRFEVCRNHDSRFSCSVVQTQPIPIVFKDGFEAGDNQRWDE